MNKKPVKVLITTIVALNPGDAAILQGTIRILKQKYGDSVDVTVYDKNAAAASKYYPWARFRPALFAKKHTSFTARFLERNGYGHWNTRLRYFRLLLALNLIIKGVKPIASLLVNQSDYENLCDYADADIIMSTGGTYLIENYDLAACIYDYRLSVRCNGCFGFFTQTLGPYKKAFNQRNFAYLFANSDFIFLRDQPSKDHVLELGVDCPPIHLAADAAFVLEPTREVQRDLEKPRKQVAISVRSLNFFHAERVSQYFQSIVDMVERLVLHYHCEVTFVSTCQGISEYWTNDSEIAKQICNSMSDELSKFVGVDEAFRQPQQVIDTFQNYDLVVATRMHAAILSICAKTPVVGIAYEFKLIELFKNLGMPELSVSVEDINGQKLCDLVDGVFGNYSEYVSRAAAGAETMSGSAWSVLDHLPT